MCPGVQPATRHVGPRVKPVGVSRSEEILRRALKGLQDRVRDRLGGVPVATGPVEVIFEGRGGGTVDPGVTLLEAAKQLHIDLNHYCGGTCSCGTCRLEILDGRRNLSKQEGREKMVLGAIHVERGHRLGCQARVQGPVRVRIPSFF